MSEQEPEHSLHGVRGVLTNAGWLYSDQIVRAVVTLFTFGLMTRSLGPENFGHLSYAIAIPGVFLPLAALGLDFVLVREFVRRPQEEGIVFSTGFWVKLASAGMAFVVCAVVGQLLPDEGDVRPLLIVTALSLLFQPSTIVDCHFQSRIASKYTAMARMTSSLVANGLRIWLATRGAPLILYAWVFALEAALLALGFVIAFRFRGPAARAPLARFDGEVARRLAREAWPLFLADFAIALYLRFDQILLNQIAGADSLGRYAAAMRLGDALEFLCIALITSYFPRIVSLHSENSGRFMSSLTRFYVLMTWLAVSIAVGVTLGAGFFVRTVMGPRFEGSVNVLILIVWGNVFATQIAVRGKWFLVESLQVRSLIIFAMGAVTHLGLLLILAPQFREYGAAWSFFLAQSCMALLFPLCWHNTRSAAKISWTSLSPWSLLK